MLEHPNEPTRALRRASYGPLLVPGVGVLVVELAESDGPADDEAIARAADPWIDRAGVLRGVVIHCRTYRGRRSVHGLLRRLRFYRKIRRVAVSCDGLLDDPTRLGRQDFVAADVRQFSFDEVDAAVAWAAAR